MQNKLSRYAAFAITGLLFAGCSTRTLVNYESPQYDILIEEGDKEIRSYRPYVVAKTTVQGEYAEAQRKAFRILAGYIFGGNTKKQDIAMTTPVTQEPVRESETIAMSTPVVQRPSDKGWVMTFMMPSEYTLEQLPVPNDSSITFETVPARTLAVIRYSWYGGKERNDAKAVELQEWLAGKKEFSPVSQPMYAGYDPPWTLPFLRRNEVMIEVVRDQE